MKLKDVKFPKETLKEATFLTWMSKNNEGKRQYMQNIGDFLARTFKQKRSHVSIEKLDADTLGKSNFKENKVIVNWFLNFYRKIPTLFHEFRHMWQRQVADNEIPHSESPETVKKWRDNFDNYKTESPEYENQPIERDAQEYEEELYDTFIEQVDAGLSKQEKTIEKALRIQCEKETLAQVISGHRYDNEVYYQAPKRVLTEPLVCDIVQSEGGRYHER